MLNIKFRKRKKKSESTARALTDKAAMKIAIAIYLLQNGFANFLNKKTKHFSGRTWKVLIIVLCACWGLFSFYVFSSALMPSSEKSMRFVLKAIPSRLIAIPKRSDSLEWMEKIYDERKKP
jgi:hypothetical protein